MLPVGAREDTVILLLRAFEASVNVWQCSSVPISDLNATTVRKLFGISTFLRRIQQYKNVPQNGHPTRQENKRFFPTHHHTPLGRVGLVEMGSRTHTKKKREPHSPPGPEHDRCSKSKTNTHTTKQKQKTYTQGGDRKRVDDGAQNSPKPAARDQRGKRRCCGARMLQDKRSTSGSWRFADECRPRDGTDRHRNRSVQLTSRECSIISKIIKRKCTYNVAEAHGPKRPAKVGRRKGNRTRSKGRRCRAMQCRVCSSLQGEGKNVASKFARNRELRTAKNRTGNKRSPPSFLRPINPTQYGEYTR